MLFPICFQGVMGNDGECAMWKLSLMLPMNFKVTFILVKSVSRSDSLRKQESQIKSCFMKFKSFNLEYSPFRLLIPELQIPL